MVLFFTFFFFSKPLSSREDFPVLDLVSGHAGDPGKTCWQLFCLFRF